MALKYIFGVTFPWSPETWFCSEKRVALERSFIPLPHEPYPTTPQGRPTSSTLRKLTELVECGCKLGEKMNAMLSEIKENVQGTNSDGKETRTQMNSLDQRKK